MQFEAAGALKPELVLVSVLVVAADGLDEGKPNVVVAVVVVEAAIDEPNVNGAAVTPLEAFACD